MMLAVGATTTLVVGGSMPVGMPVAVARTVEFAVPVGKKVKDDERIAPIASAVALPLGVMVMMLKVGKGAVPGQEK